MKNDYSAFVRGKLEAHLKKMENMAAYHGDVAASAFAARDNVLAEYHAMQANEYRAKAENTKALLNGELVLD